MFNLGQRASRGIVGERIVKRDYYPFRGGLNVIDPFLSVKPGQMLSCSNYEPYWRGGYRRVQGFERFDGRPAPSEATYTVLFFDTITNPLNQPDVGNTVTWPGGSGDVILMLGTSIVLGDYTGDDPEVGDDINFGGVYATVSEVRVDDTKDDANNIVARVAAQTARRNVIQAVPGSGPIRGVVRYSGVTYAFRDNVAGTKCVMFESTSSGWSEVTFNPILRFDTGVTEIVPGDSITGADSGATADVERVVIDASGSWAGGDAAGFLVLSNIVGSFNLVEDIEVSAAVVASTSGSAVFTPEFSPGGRFEFRISSFSGAQTEQRLYGCNGLDTAWEYNAADGLFTPIETGMPVDTPTHIAAHNRMLFLAFQGGSVQNSGVNDPLSWTVATGANELLVGGEVTNFVEEVNDALLIYTRDNVKVLYGNTSADFNLVTLNNEIGAFPYTASRIGQTVHLDQRGVSSVAATEAYGNFVTTNMSQLIQPILNQKKAEVFGAQISRQLNLWRLFYNDGTAIVLGYEGNRPAGFTLIDYGKNITALWSSQTEGNRERLFFGDDEGFVFEQDVGTSFDGEDIEAFALFVFYHSGSPEQNKRYRKGILEMSGASGTLKGSVDVNYGNTGVAGAKNETLVSRVNGGFWNVESWNEFKWSEGAGTDPAFYIEDTGFNIGLHLYHRQSTEDSHVLNGFNVTWSPRRLKREF